MSIGTCTCVWYHMTAILIFFFHLPYSGLQLAPASFQVQPVSVNPNQHVGQIYLEGPPRFEVATPKTSQEAEKAEEAAATVKTCPENLLEIAMREIGDDFEAENADTNLFAPSVKSWPSPAPQTSFTTNDVISTGQVMEDKELHLISGDVTSTANQTIKNEVVDEDPVTRFTYYDSERRRHVTRDDDVIAGDDVKPCTSLNDIICPPEEFQYGSNSEIQNKDLISLEAAPGFTNEDETADAFKQEFVSTADGRSHFVRCKEEPIGGMRIAKKKKYNRPIKQVKLSEEEKKRSEAEAHDQLEEHVEDDVQIVREVLKHPEDNKFGIVADDDDDGDDDSDIEIIEVECVSGWTKADDDDDNNDSRLIEAKKEKVEIASKKETNFGAKMSELRNHFDDKSSSVDDDEMFSCEFCGKKYKFLNFLQVHNKRPCTMCTFDDNLD